MIVKIGTNQAETIVGSSGDDSIYGSGGNDRLISLDGNDLVEGGDGDDEINAFYSIVDAAFLVYPSNGSKLLAGGNGHDTIHGSRGPDTVLGQNGNDHLAGDIGDDRIFGGEGNDNLEGNAGNDYLEGNAGNDDIYGGEGNDTLDGGVGGDLMAGGYGDDVYYIDSTLDRVSDFEGIDKAYVSADWVKIPATIESVILDKGTERLPYWIDALIPGATSGSYFGSLVGPSNQMYYSFPTNPPAHDVGSGRDIGFVAMSPDQKVQVKKVLDYLQSIIGLKFIETADPARLNSINFSYNKPGFVGGYSIQPSDTPAGSDVYIAVDALTSTLAEDSFGLGVLVHELGHALGLKHPVDTRFENPDAVDEGPFIPDSEAKTSVTIMGQKVKDVAGYKISLSPFDVAALQYLYGPSKSVRTGNDTYALKTTEANFIWDAVGTDTITAAGASQPVTLYLEPGFWSYFGANKLSTITSAGQITINFGSSIENAVGTSYADLIFGSSLSNSIEGGDGADGLEGAAGNDTLFGASANDTLDGGSGIDQAVYTGTRSNYQLVKQADSNWAVTDQRVFAQVVGGPQGDGIDQLVSMERLKFSDKSLSIDLDGNAGNAARTLATVFGKDALKNTTYAGIAISLFDQGMTKDQVSQVAIDAVFGANPKSTDVVKLLWKNLFNADIDASNLAYYSGLIDSKAMTAAQLTTVAADLDLTAQLIDIAGLSKSGWEYVPFGT